MDSTAKHADSDGLPIAFNGHSIARHGHWIAFDGHDPSSSWITSPARIAANRRPPKKELFRP
jgi:hypothetical protein